MLSKQNRIRKSLRTEKKAAEKNNAARTSASTTISDQSLSTIDAIALLKADHRKVEQLFEKFEKLNNASEKEDLVKQICQELIIHTQIEEEIFYPACREKAGKEAQLDEAQVEHDGAKVLICDLLAASASSDCYDAKVKVLCEYIKHHVGEEEKIRSGIFAMAQKSGLDMTALGERLQTRKKLLMATAQDHGPDLPSSRVINLHPTLQEKPNMPKNSNYRDRDEHGRFASDDDNNSMRRSGSSRNEDYANRSYESRNRDNDRSYGNRSSYNQNDNGTERDYMRNAGRRDEYSGRTEEDYGDDNRGRGRGWYGDSEGHAEAARSSRNDYQARSNRGNDRNYDDDRLDYTSQNNRGGGYSRSRSNYNDNQGYSSYADTNDRDEQGRFTSSSRGRNQRGFDDDQMNRDSHSRNQNEDHRGWYGDSEGHTRAARAGWTNR